MARSQRGSSNSAAADARASDRMAGKSQTPTAASKARCTTSDVPAEAPTAASKARSTTSEMPAEAPASAATTAWTGFRCVGNWRNCEEQDRGGGNTFHEASFGGSGRFPEMAHGPPKSCNLHGSVSLRVHCDERKEKDRLFIGARPVALTFRLRG
jgi:hypothetical protein